MHTHIHSHQISDNGDDGDDGNDGDDGWGNDDGWNDAFDDDDNEGKNDDNGDDDDTLPLSHAEVFPLSLLFKIFTNVLLAFL